MGVARPMDWPAPRKRRRVRISKKALKTGFAWFALALLTLASLTGIAFTLFLLRIRDTLPTTQQIASFRPAQPTRILSTDGVVLAELATEYRQVVPLKEISPNVTAATLAVEDTRFFEHGGFDLKGIVRAAVANVTGGDITGQGGSTITQQLARNVNQFGLSNRKSLERKFRELLTAVRIEQVFSKNEILELYLNQVYYGSGAYGVAAASRIYFGKAPGKLTVAEAALLAGLPQRPALYSPFVSRKAAIGRRNTVLARMVATGRLSQADYRKAIAEPLHLARRKASETLAKAPYFVDLVVQKLVNRYGFDAVYSGWTIQTTLNWEMQQAAEKAIASPLPFGASQAALVALDPHTGQIRALVGGRNYRRDRYNAVTQGRRQPGSAFKPFVYAAAFDSGAADLNTSFRDEPLSYPSAQGTWVVHNYESNYSYQRITILDALVHSINTVAVRTADEIGVDKVVYYAQHMGITTDLDAHLPLALGASAVRPLDLCAAYGALANQGVRYRPTAILSVQDAEGELVEADDAAARRIEAFLKPNTVNELNYALHEVVQRGTGTAASVIPMAFGKTGTTSDHRDAWFAGFTPNLATVVWAAHPVRSRSGKLAYQSMPGGTGGHVAAPIWAQFMKKADPIQRIANRLNGGLRYTIALPAPNAEPDSRPRARRPAAAARSAGQAQEAATPATAEDDAAPRASGDVQPISAIDPPRQYGVTYEHPAVVASARAGAHHAEAGITQRICADSGALAGPWCPTTVMVTVTSGHPITRRCTMHHPPDGD